MRYPDDIDELIDKLTDLTDIQKSTIKSRYRFLMAEYRYRCRIYSALFYVLRLTMTVGSLAVPALLSIQSTCDKIEALYWFTWSLSLAVTTANGILTLFKLDRRFFMLHATAERLRSETWQYISLSGRYSGHHGHGKPSHASQFVYYCSQLEKVHMKHIDEEFIKNADMDSAHPHASPLQSGQHACNHNPGAMVPSPPPMDTPISNGIQQQDQIQLQISRKESSTSLGSDEAPNETDQEETKPSSSTTLPLSNVSRSSL
jgi:hypothetical protein